MKRLLLGALVLTATTLMNPTYVVAKESSQIEQVNEKININQATAEQLTQLKGIGEAKAQAIVEYRKQIGKFTSIDQLTEVKGVGDKIIADNKDNMTL